MERDGVLCDGPAQGSLVAAGDRLAAQESSPCPREQWSPLEDRTAVTGDAPYLELRLEAGSHSRCTERRPEGIVLDAGIEPQVAALDDFLPVKGGETVAAAEFGRLNASGRIARYPEGRRPPQTFRRASRS